MRALFLPTGQGRVAIIGGGPSLAAVDLAPLRGRMLVIGLNNAYQRVPWCDWLFFQDTKWGRHHAEALAGYAGTLVTSTPDRLPDAIEARVIRVCRVRQYAWADPVVMSPDPDTIAGADSGAQAIDLAAHLGAAEIFLFGFDMRFVDGRAHWHADHPWPTSERWMTMRYLPQHPRIKAAADARGIRIWNATAGSAIACYPAVTMAEICRSLGGNQPAARVISSG